jgi:hypothetical protein
MYGLYKILKIGKRTLFITAAQQHNGCQQQAVSPLVF